MVSGMTRNYADFAFWPNREVEEDHCRRIDICSVVTCNLPPQRFDATIG